MRDANAQRPAPGAFFVGGANEARRQQRGRGQSLRKYDSQETRGNSDVRKSTDCCCVLGPPVGCATLYVQL